MAHVSQQPAAPTPPRNDIRQMLDGLPDQPFAFATGRKATRRGSSKELVTRSVVRLLDRHQLRFPGNGRQILRLATHR